MKGDRASDGECRFRLYASASPVVAVVEASPLLTLATPRSAAESATGTTSFLRTSSASSGRLATSVTMRTSRIGKTRHSHKRRWPHKRCPWVFPPVCTQTLFGPPHVSLHVVPPFTSACDGRMHAWQLVLPPICPPATRTVVCDRRSGC